MDTPRARIRVSLSAREIEIEGSEEFVASYAEHIDSLIARLDNAGELVDAPEPDPAPAPAVAARTSARPPAESFGEYVQHMPKTITDVDRMLAAGWYAQRGNSDNAFGTGEANRLLAEQSVKIGNPSQCVKQNLLAKRVFALQRGRYRVSQQGMEHLRQLLGAAIQLG